eukprot:scaffold17768_cov31-Tisochrysis_lutea.AAC.9
MQLDDSNDSSMATGAELRARDQCTREALAPLTCRWPRPRGARSSKYRRAMRALGRDGRRRKRSNCSARDT